MQVAFKDIWRLMRHQNQQSQDVVNERAAHTSRLVAIMFGKHAIFHNFPRSRICHQALTQRCPFTPSTHVLSRQLSVLMLMMFTSQYFFQPGCTSTVVSCSPVTPVQGYVYLAAWGWSERLLNELLDAMVNTLRTTGMRTLQCGGAPRSTGVVHRRSLSSASPA